MTCTCPLEQITSRLETQLKEGSIVLQTSRPLRRTKKSLKRAIDKALPEAELDHESVSSVKQLADVAGQTVQSIDTKLIDVNKANRKLTNDKSIHDLIDSIQTFGQNQPAIVRKKGKRYELISGERRLRACIVLERRLEAIVVEDNDTESLVRLVVANSNRKDLNAIEKAEAMELLMQHGLSRLDAAKAVGLTSDSGAKNQLRFLRLPDSIKKLIIDGTLSERAARRLIPYSDLPAALDYVAEELTDKNEGSRLESLASLLDESSFPYIVEEAIDRTTRPMDKRTCGAQIIKNRWTHQPKLFPGDGGIETKSIEVNGKTWLITTDTKKWDELQRPLLERKLKGDDKPASKAATKAATKTDAKLSPKEEAKIKAEKRKEQDERLSRWTGGFLVPALIRCHLATYPPQDWEQLLTWLTASHNSFRSSVFWASLTEIEHPPTKMRGVPSGAIDVKLHNEVLWRLLLWPVSVHGSKSKKAKGHIAPAGCLPDLDYISRELYREEVLALSKRFSVDAETCWKAATQEGPLHELVRVWLERHTLDQIDDLQRELKVLTRDGSRTELAEHILSAHAKKPLPCPKLLKKELK